MTMHTLGNIACFVAIIGLSMAAFGVVIPLMFCDRIQRRVEEIKLEWPQPWDNEPAE